MMNDSGFESPLIEDPNTTVGAYPWDGDYGATRNTDTTSMAVMSDPAPSFVAPQMDATDEQHMVSDNNPEGADMGQTGDAGGDADGQNFGQDQGSQDRMEADSVNVPMVGSVSLITLGVVGLVGYWLWSRRE
jgi:hypothetical protein